MSSPFYWIFLQTFLNFFIQKLLLKLQVKCPWCGCTLATWEYGDQVMGRHRRSQPGCPFVLNVSNNVPMSTSPQPPSQQQQIIPSQVEELTGEIAWMSSKKLTRYKLHVFRQWLESESSFQGKLNNIVKHFKHKYQSFICRHNVIIL